MQVVKLTFARGASIEDPKKLFNSSLEGNTRRALNGPRGKNMREIVYHRGREFTFVDQTSGHSHHLRHRPRGFPLYRSIRAEAGAATGATALHP